MTLVTGDTKKNFAIFWTNKDCRLVEMAEEDKEARRLQFGCQRVGKVRSGGDKVLLVGGRQLLGEDKQLVEVDRVKGSLVLQILGSWCSPAGWVV